MEEAIAALKRLASDPLASFTLNSEHATLLHKDRLARHKQTLQVGKEKERKKPSVGKRKTSERSQAQASASFEPRRATPRPKFRKILRCSSPCHYYNADNIQQYGPDYLNELPDRKRVDKVLKAVTTLYYRDNKDDTSGSHVVEVSPEGRNFFFSTIDLLTNCLRKPSVLDTWAPREIALFEAGISTYGKDFYQIQKLIKNKKTSDCVQFYYFWKHSGHYQMWKSLRKQKSASASKT